MIHGNSQIISFKAFFGRFVVWAHTTSLTLPNFNRNACTYLQAKLAGIYLCASGIAMAC